MRYPHGFAITIPYVDTNEDGSTSWNRALLHTNDPLDRRRVKRVLRQWVWSQLGRQLHTAEMRLLMKKVIKHNEPRSYVRMPELKPPAPVVDELEARADAERADWLDQQDDEMQQIIVDALDRHG